jgi:hypothetical protein
MVYATQNYWVCRFYPTSGIQVFSSYFEFLAIDKVHKLSNSEQKCP